MALYKWEKSRIEYTKTKTSVDDPTIRFSEKYYYSETWEPPFENGIWKFERSRDLPGSTTAYNVEGYFVSNIENASVIYYGMDSSSDISGSSKMLRGFFTKYTSSPGKGAFIEFVYSTDQSAYPNGGISGGYYYDQREIVVPPPPTALNVPDIAMQGNQIMVSWPAVSIADSYILERKSDTDADWTQVYSGANTSFEEAVGTWTSVQYRVKAGVSGTYGDYTTSASVPVVSASAVVISGSDGNLGTLVNDVSYTVSSDGTNPLTVTEIINGTTARTFTATNGANNKISVMDLPTGTGTIKITASTNPGSGVVTVTRNWTYSKTAPTFANTGSTAQLQQNGKNIFPLTLLECVRGGENLAPGGYGLGTPAQLRASANDCKLSGWYMTAFNVPNAPDGDGGYWLIRVDGRDDTVLYQTAYANRQNSGVPNSVICRRYYVNSEWSPWEYITPPMQLGVEYRTVERYNGKPVYVKAVNIGELSTGYGEKSIEHGVSNMKACIECKGLAGQRNLILSRGVTAVTVDSETIFIEKDSGFSKQSEVVAIIKYTKTTD